VHPSLKLSARKIVGVLVCAAAFATAGCHRNNLNSGYGIAWVTLTAEPGSAALYTAAPADFTSYQVTIDSVTLTRNDGAIVTAVSTPEVVDFTQLTNIAELWSATGSVSNGTYLSASITVDYTNAVISVLANGVPTPATVTDKNGAAVTTITETVTFDPANPFVVVPTYASTSAQRLAIDFDLAASGWGTTSIAPPSVIVSPYFTVTVLPADTKLTRVRGPLINSNTVLGTYTVYLRPFYDETSSLGSLTLFNSPNTLYSIDGKVYTGGPGVDALSLLSAGITMTASYTTFVPDVNPANAAPAGTFYPVYMVGGSTLEDEYTEGLSGDVIARTGDTLTLRNSTLFLNTADTVTFEAADTQLLLGSGTTVTADGTTLTGLNSSSIAVGQHITARGVCVQCTTSPIEIDATGTTATNTGSVRLQSTDLWGSLVSSASGSLVMNVQSIDGLPASVFDFAGNGAATPAPASFSVNTGSLLLPSDAAPGATLWVSGLAAPFGSAPPDFTASAVNTESTVQVAAGTGTPAGTQSCGLGSLVCEPASLRVLYVGAGGTTTPFVSLTDAGFTVDLSNPQLATAVIRIGPEVIDLTTLAASPQVVPTTLPVTSTFAPLYTVGNPTSSSTTPTVTTATTTIQEFSSFASFVSAVNSSVSSTNNVLQIEARGVYDRAANVFTATTVNVVL